MNIVYSENEKQAEREIIKEIVKKFKSEDRVEVIRDGLAAMVKEAVREAVKYDAMSKEEAPERYCVFYPHVYPVENGGWLTEIMFYHTNRRSPLSTDGFVMVISKCYIYKNHTGNIEIIKPVEDFDEL